MFNFLNGKSLVRYTKLPDVTLGDHASPRRSRPLKYAALVLAILALSLVTWLLYIPKPKYPRELSGPIPTISKDFRTVALVFYGRRSRVEILDCYLKVGHTTIAHAAVSSC